MTPTPATKTAPSTVLGLAPLRHVLGNGLVLLMLPKHDLPIVAVEAYVPAGQTREPADRAGVAVLTGRMMSEGTKRYTGLEIAQRIEAVGGELYTGSGGAWMEVRSGELGLGLDLIHTCLFEPTFPAEQFDKEREKQLATILAHRDSPERVAHQAFDAAIYGKHPFARPMRGTLETVRRLRPRDCKAHHQANMAPNRLVIAIAGDFDPDRARALVAERFGDLPRTKLPNPRIPRVRRQRRTREVRVATAKQQSHIYLGHLGVRRTDPDWYRLEVMDHILGLGSGFTDRLSRILRDELGLAYSVYATISHSAQREPGTFHAYIGTAPENEAEAVAEMVRQIRRIRDEPVSKRELEGAKAFLTGSFVFRFETVRQLCHFLIQRERYKLDDYLSGYPRWIEAVTADDIGAVARKHLDPDHLTLAVAGPPA